MSIEDIIKNANKKEELKNNPLAALPDLVEKQNEIFGGISVITLKGDKGDEGPQGERGEKGDKGDKGDKPIAGVDYPIPKEFMPLNGEKGDKGTDGKDGKDGRNGFNGSNGLDGKDGRDGKDGKRGLAGLDGRNGKDGSPDTPDQIIDKIKKSKKKIELSKIEGLEKEIQTLRGLIRTISVAKGGSSGGGMGLPVHEQFNGDGVTVSFTLSYNVAAQGTAVFGCRYQGQTLYLGDQFTISGKTLTLVGFIPTDGTKIEISYIRT